MAVAAQTQVSNADRVRRHIAHKGRSHQESVAIKLEAPSIVVEMEASLNRISLANKILAKDISDIDILMPGIEPVQTAVRVLLEHREVCSIELNPVVVECTKEACTKVVVGKYEPAKVRNEWLDTCAHRNEIIIGVHICQLNFTKRFFE